MSSDLIFPQPGYETMRRWPRFKMDVPVQVITQGLTKPVVVAGRGSELNNGGMSVMAGTELAIGAQVLVEFTPPYSSGPIRARCFVRNRFVFRYGVEFITESDDDYESVHQIEAVLRRLGSAVTDTAVDDMWH